MRTGELHQRSRIYFWKYAQLSLGKIFKKHVVGILWLYRKKLSCNTKLTCEEFSGVNRYWFRARPVSCFNRNSRTVVNEPFTDRDKSIDAIPYTSLRSGRGSWCWLFAKSQNHWTICSLLLRFGLIPGIDVLLPKKTSRQKMKSNRTSGCYAKTRPHNAQGDDLSNLFRCKYGNSCYLILTTKKSAWNSVRKMFFSVCIFRTK